MLDTKKVLISRKDLYKNNYQNKKYKSHVDHFIKIDSSVIDIFMIMNDTKK